MWLRLLRGVLSVTLDLVNADSFHTIALLSYSVTPLRRRHRKPSRVPKLVLRLPIQDHT